MKPVIVLTVCRRYYELRKNIKAIWERASEFAEPPQVVVVWARPEIGRLWLFQELMAEGLIHHVVGRPALPGEVDGVATTYPESHSLRKGLEFVREHYGENCYVIGQAADVQPKPGIYRMMDEKMREGDKAVLFLLPTNIVHSDIWHTNFFCVCLDENYWPPLSEQGDQDILERKWGLQLKKRALPGIFAWHNNRNKSFVHSHESENQEPELFKPQRAGVGIGLFIVGRKRWYLRVWDWMRNLFSGVWPNRR